MVLVAAHQVERTVSESTLAKKMKCIVAIRKPLNESRCCHTDPLLARLSQGPDREAGRSYARVDPEWMTSTRRDRTEFCTGELLKGKREGRNPAGHPRRE